MKYNLLTNMNINNKIESKNKQETDINRKYGFTDNMLR